MAVAGVISILSVVMRSMYIHMGIKSYSEQRGLTIFITELRSSEV